MYDILILILIFYSVPYEFAWVPTNYTISRKVFTQETTGSNYGTIFDVTIWSHCYLSSYPNVVAYNCPTTI